MLLDITDAFETGGPAIACTEENNPVRLQDTWVLILYLLEYVYSTVGLPFSKLTWGGDSGVKLQKIKLN